MRLSHVIALLNDPNKIIICDYFTTDNWKPSSKSELTPIIFTMELTHLGLGASNLFSKFNGIF